MNKKRVALLCIAMISSGIFASESENLNKNSYCELQYFCYQNNEQDFSQENSILYRFNSNIYEEKNFFDEDNFDKNDDENNVSKYTWKKEIYSNGFHKQWLQLEKGELPKLDYKTAFDLHFFYYEKEISSENSQKKSPNFIENYEEDFPDGWKMAYVMEQFFLSGIKEKESFFKFLKIIHEKHEILSCRLFDPQYRLHYKKKFLPIKDINLCFVLKKIIYIGKNFEQYSITPGNDEKNTCENLFLNKKKWNFQPLEGVTCNDNELYEQCNDIGGDMFITHESLCGERSNEKVDSMKPLKESLEKFSEYETLIKIYKLGLKGIRKNWNNDIFLKECEKLISKRKSSIDIPIKKLAIVLVLLGFLYYCHFGFNVSFKKNIQKNLECDEADMATMFSMLEMADGGIGL